MFMVGSFASGLSEGLTAGWTLGKDIQDRGYEQERRAKFKKAEAEKAGGGTLPPLIDVGAKAPSPLEADPAGTGTSGGGGDTFDPDHPDAQKPATIKDGRVVTTPQPVAALPSQRPTTMPDGSASSTVPALARAVAVPPATGPVVAEAAVPPAQEAPIEQVIPPTVLPPTTPSWDPARAIAPYVPQQGLGAAAGSALRRALPAAQNWIGARVNEFRNAPAVQSPWFAQPGGFDRAVNQAISTTGQTLNPPPPPGVITTPAVGGNQGYVLPNPQTGVTVDRPRDQPVHYDPRTGKLVPY